MNVQENLGHHEDAAVRSKWFQDLNDDFEEVTGVGMGILVMGDGQARMDQKYLRMILDRAKAGKELIEALTKFKEWFDKHDNNPPRDPETCPTSPPEAKKPGEPT